MSELFALLGVVLAGYTAYSVWTGSVFARQGVWGRSFLRSAEPFRFWSVIVIYAGLSLALVFYF